MLLDVKFISNFYKYKRKLNIFGSSFALQKRFLENSNGLKILFFGTDNFSLQSFQAISNKSSSGIDTKSVGAVTLFKSPANCVKQFAENKQIQLYKWPVTADICRKYDLGVVVSFGHLIPEEVINAFPLGMINVHASLLPRWRGAAPIIYTILKGDVKTGVTIMKIEPKKFDIGDILAQAEIEIDKHVLMPQLHDLLAKEGAKLLIRVISGYPQSFQNTFKQNNKEATYAPKVSESITQINWRTMSSTEIYNQFRALYGFKPLRTKFKSINLKIFELKLSSDEAEKQKSQLREPGSFQYVRGKKCFRVLCADKKMIDIFKIKAEHKPIMSVVDFNNGFCQKYNSDALFFSN